MFDMKILKCCLQCHVSINIMLLVPHSIILYIERSYFSFKYHICVSTLDIKKDQLVSAL